ncbi:hypothetical protein SCHPADRAFT_928791 [Schizopora paradoxa]|uniref:Uncharacterized protein n=1 Tax=Schizopora paradoxa TaxID=27342 RepID=A0A0H2S8C0_9AGAM|nr:hypothetical protein SCHPADRAFT_928791 [Schizopora paradoxa]
MPHPVQDEPSWKEEISRSTTDGAKSYSRPLLGVEIGYDLCTRKADGLTEVCLGFTFNTLLSPSDLITRTRDSLAIARFQMPSIACTVVSDPCDEDLRSWKYTTLQNGDRERLSSWIDESLTIRRGAFDTEAFISEMNQSRTPYVHADGHEQHIHFYLFIEDSVAAASGTLRAALFLHGGHIILDVRPALRCLSALFDWIMTNPPVLAEIAWGTEWKRLPAGPLTATGGPRDDFDTKGMELLQRAGALMMDPDPSLSINTPRTTVAHPGKVIRFNKSFDKQTSSEILQACKKAGFTMQHLTDAALMLHVAEAVEANGMNGVDPSKAHITLNPTVIAQESFLVPPHNCSSHFVGGLIMLPIRVMYSSIPPPTTSRKERLLYLMSKIRSQYDDYLTNKNTPHIFPAMLALAPNFPPRELPPSINSNTSTMSNLGNLNKFVECSRGSERDKVTFEIEDFAVGVRVTRFQLSFHTWSLNECLHMLIQASDARDGEDVRRYLDEFADIMLFITKHE